MFLELKLPAPMFRAKKIRATLVEQRSILEAVNHRKHRTLCAALCQVMLLLKSSDSQKCTPSSVTLLEILSKSEAVKTESWHSQMFVFLARTLQYTKMQTPLLSMVKPNAKHHAQKTANVKLLGILLKIRWLRTESQNYKEIVIIFRPLRYRVVEKMLGWLIVTFRNLRPICDLIN